MRDEPRFFPHGSFLLFIRSGLTAGKARPRPRIYMDVVEVVGYRCPDPRECAQCRRRAQLELLLASALIHDQSDAANQRKRESKCADDGRLHDGDSTDERTSLRGTRRRVEAGVKSRDEQRDAKDQRGNSQG